MGMKEAKLDMGGLMDRGLSYRAGECRGSSRMIRKRWSSGCGAHETGIPEERRVDSPAQSQGSPGRAGSLRG
jgi:hypothetical protein